MNASQSPDPWNRLVQLARKAPEERIEEAPPGFSTRLAALAFQARSPWERLVRLVRGISDDRDPSAPPGFATRVVALAFSRPDRAMTSIFEALAPRALWIAGFLVLASLALNYSAFFGDSAPLDELLLDVDPVSVAFSSSS